MINKYIDMLVYCSDVPNVVAQTLTKEAEVNALLDPEQPPIKLVHVMVDDSGNPIGAKWNFPAHTISISSDGLKSLSLFRFTKHRYDRIDPYINTIPSLEVLGVGAPEDGGPIQEMFVTGIDARVNKYREFWPASQAITDEDGNEIVIDRSFPDGNWRAFEFAGDSNLRKMKRALEA